MADLVPEPVLTGEEEELVRERSFYMEDGDVAELLQELARREVALVRDHLLGSDPSMREASMWNLAALVAAIERFNPARRARPGQGTPGDPPGPPPTPG